MGVIAETADRVAVMYAGRLAEIGPVERVVKEPRHPYTRGLMGSVPVVGGRLERLTPKSTGRCRASAKFRPAAPFTRVAPRRCHAVPGCAPPHAPSRVALSPAGSTTDNPDDRPDPRRIREDAASLDTRPEEALRRLAPAAEPASWNACRRDASRRWTAWTSTLRAAPAFSVLGALTGAASRPSPASSSASTALPRAGSTSRGSTSPTRRPGSRRSCAGACR